MRLVPPKPPRSSRLRTQVESFVVLRRNPLELWGPAAYRELRLEGRFLGRSQLLINGPDAIRHVLVTNAANYRRTLPTRRVLRPLLGDGLFLAEGESWKYRRRIVAPALAPRAMPMLAGHVLRAIGELLPNLHVRTHRPIELLPVLQHLALGIAGHSMFSLEMASFGTRLRALLFDYATRYGRVGLFDLVLPDGRPSAADRGRQRFAQHWQALLDMMINAREKAPPPEHARDLFDLLRDAIDPETGLAFSRAELRDEIATLILAGHETTAVTLFWSLFLAARSPDWQSALCEEAKAAPLDRLARADLAALPKLRAHIEEALRLYPPAFLLVREAIGADEVAGHAITPGTVVSVAPWVVHRHLVHWRDADAFNPERFLGPPPSRYTYLPFGAGPRVCVGAQFALTEAILVLARLFAHFRVSLPSRATVLPRALVTTQPDRRVDFILEPR